MYIDDFVRLYVSCVAADFPNHATRPRHRLDVGGGGIPPASVDGPTAGGTPLRGVYGVQCMTGMKYHTERLLDFVLAMRE